MKNLKRKPIMILTLLMILSCVTLNANEPKIKKINYEGEQGYFINQAYYNEILILHNDNGSLLKKNTLLNELVNDYEKRTRNALRFNVAKNNIMTVSIGINVSLIALFIGYNAYMFYKP